MLSLILTLLLSWPLPALELDPPIPRPRVTFVNPLFISRGFVAGTITQLRSQGLPFWHFRYEGAAFHGVGSIRGPLIDASCAREKAAPPGDTDCVVENNPWPFSFFDTSLFTRYRGLAAGPVVLAYDVPTVAPTSIVTNTKNFIYGLWLVDSNLPIEAEKVSAGIPVSRFVTSEKGVVRGRVVRASVEDMFFKTYEVIIQSVEQGHDFKALSVSDPALFDYLVDSMFAGKTMSLEFVRIAPGTGAISDFRGYWTHFRVLKAAAL